MTNLVVNTWPFTSATDAAWNELMKSEDAMMAVEKGCTEAEYNITIPTVGYGGSPDENNNVTLDALIMNGDSMEAGSVASMPYVKNAIKVAHYVLKYTRHTLLVGEAAANFAKEMGFPWENLSTNKSESLWHEWRAMNCQPNFRRNVKPDPSKHCGPYLPEAYSKGDVSLRVPNTVDEYHHDTIGMLVMNRSGSIAVGTSTNGAIHRVAGRVGDTPVVGAGGYADSSVGAAAGTGDGDVLMRFLLSYKTVDLMQQGLSPTRACEESLRKVKQAGAWSGALVAINRAGQFGGACVGFTNYEISLRNHSTGKSAVTIPIKCFDPTTPANY